MYAESNSNKALTHDAGKWLYRKIEICFINMYNLGWSVMVQP